MKALFDGRDFYLLLENDELSLVKESKLEADLKDYFDKEVFGKKTTLEFRKEVTQPDGVEIRYFPENEVWKGIREISFYINDRAVHYLETDGRVMTRQITDDKIEIYVGRHIMFENR